MIPEAPRKLDNTVELDIGEVNAFFVGIGLSAGWAVGSAVGKIILHWLGLP